MLENNCIRIWYSKTCNRIGSCLYIYKQVYNRSLWARISQGLEFFFLISLAVKSLWSFKKKTKEDNQKQRNKCEQINVKKEEADSQYWQPKSRQSVLTAKEST